MLPPCQTCFVYAPMVSCPPSFVSAAGIVGAGAMGAATLQQAGAGANIPAVVLPISAGGTPSAQQLLEKFLQGMAELERLLEAADQDAGLSELPQDHKIQHALCLIPMVAAQSSSCEETALALLQEAVQLLFKIDSKLGHEVNVVLLNQLCEISLKAACEVSAWLIYAEDEHKFNIPVTVSLVHTGLVNIAELYSHEEFGIHFQQKPFFQLFSSLLHNLHATKSSLGPAYTHAFLAISNMLNTLQPSFFLCFSFSWMLLVSHRMEENFDKEELLNEGCATPQQATNLKEDKSIEDVSTPTPTSSAFDTQAPML
ncbi:hypothetical protein NDA13_002131 [Ustilago tritici]|nr:hypothetical protein NDA13_002131 [Ustilago tritici]